MDCKCTKNIKDQKIRAIIIEHLFPSCVYLIRPPQDFINTTKKNNQKVSKPGRKVDKPRGETDEFQNIIPSDSILAEKDEVKNAEERLKLRKEESKGKK